MLRLTITTELILAVLMCAVPSRGQAADRELRPIRLPTGGELTDVDFERHVTSLLGRLGCNSAACHGSFQGKGGFRLSLFGQSPEFDYRALLGNGAASRVDPQTPAESLVLIKGTGGDGHGGGVRFQPDSWEHEVFRRWIAGGAKRNAERGAVTRLVLEPAEVPPLKTGASCDLHAWAEFRDGTREDVTSFAEFRSRDDTIAAVDSLGHLQAKAPGDTALIVSYRGNFASAAVWIPHERDLAQTAISAPRKLPRANWIDDEVNGQLERLNLDVSPAADDAEFLRRVTLDVIGRLPTPDEVEKFQKDHTPDKRALKIDALLQHPRRAVAWATRLCEMTACNVDQLGNADGLRARRAKMWHDWFRKRIDEKLPYDQLVHGVLCAVSRQGEAVDDWIDQEIAHEKTARAGFESHYAERPSLDLFWRRMGPQGRLPVEDLAELTASAFLGLRLHCARCHQHPYDRWSQEDFAGYANIFSRVEFGSSTELRVAMTQRLERRREAKQAGQVVPELPRLQEVYLASHPRELVDAQEAASTPARPPGGSPLEASGDPREALFRWLAQPENPYFAPNLVNRVWARYFGAGIVEPVDSFSAANPATHPQLLTKLSAEFVRSGYDLRALERLILNSEAYQRSSRPTGNNALDQHNFAHARVRPLPADVLIDSLNQALEAKDSFGNDAPEGSQALELAVNHFNDPAIQTMFRVLGRSERTSLCECDTPMLSSVRRSLFLMSDPRIVGKIAVGRLARLLDAGRTDAEIMQEFYLAVLSRPPEADEREFCLQQVAAAQSRAQGWADVVWALVNSREFSSNH
ncbi:MAG: DUF1549 domain-containing protein [Planctomycetes bacterium]|nr:DUF1549 domain-containing protein [Planctomycetota bacterium]